MARDIRAADWRWEALTAALPVDSTAREVTGTSLRRDPQLLPVMAVREPALQHNVDVMASWCADRGAHLAPHAKTTMSPEVLERQLQAGAWGVTVATATQARTVLAFGVRRIVLANTVVSPAAIAWLGAVARDRDVEVLLFADSLRAVRLLEANLEHGDTLDVLVELGLPGRRGGARTRSEATAVAEVVAASPHLRLAGVSAYEGVVATDRDAATLDEVRSLCDAATAVTSALQRRALFEREEPVLSAGGSAYVDLVADQCTKQWPAGGGPRLLLRSGCYVTHDHGLYERLGPRMARNGLQPALELWAEVLSVPERGLAVVGAGRRECPDDAGGPRLLRAFRGGASRNVEQAAVVRMFDHHAVFAPGDGLEVGDVVVLGISHPCSAFSRWRLLPLLDDDDVVVGRLHSYV